VQKEERMFTSIPITGLANAIGLALALLALVVPVAQAGTSRPPSISKAEYRALMLRGEALNQKYGLGAQRAVPQGMTAAEYRALMLRGEALNKRYGLDKQKAAAVTSQPTKAGGSPQRSNPSLRNDIAHFENDAGVSAPASSVRPTSPAPVVVSVERGFDWASAGVGAAAGFGLLLALGVAATAMRARQRAQAQA